MKRKLFSLLLALALFVAFAGQCLAAEDGPLSFKDNTVDLTGVFNSTVNGTLDSVSMYDASGNPIEVKGASVTGIGGNTLSKYVKINVTVPRSVGIKDGKVKGTFAFTRTSEDATSPNSGTALPLVTNHQYNKNDASDKTKWDAESYIKNTTTTLSTYNGKCETGYLFFSAYNAEDETVDQQRFNLYVWVENAAPVLTGDTASAVSINADETYTLDYAGLFSDPDSDDTLKYTVWLDGAKKVDKKTTTSYTFPATKIGGKYTVKVQATDVMQAVSPEYTLTITVRNQTETYPVSVTAPDGVAPAFYYRADAQDGAELAASTNGNVYTLAVPTNISTIAWRANGIGASTDVVDGAAFSLVNTTYKAMCGDVEDTGATVTVSNAVGNAHAFLLRADDSYTVTATPSAEFTDYKKTEFKNRKPVDGTDTLKLDTQETQFVYPGDWRNPSRYKLTVSELPSRQGDKPVVLEPSGSSIYNMMTGYTTPYLLTNGKVYEYRVTSTDDTDVTYVGVLKKTKNTPTSISVAKNLVADGNNGRNTVDHELEPYTSAKQSVDSANYADIYLNTNAKGYINLVAGETKNLIPVRAWWATSGGGWTMSGYYFVEPDYHYTVIDINGNASTDVIEVSADGTISAKGAGTAIVLVTYDAMNVNFPSELYQGCETPIPGGFYGAIWPENTGVLVVTVDAEDSGIDTGMTINTGKDLEKKTEGNKLDADLDVIYFVGEKGEYTFTPLTEGVSVSVANPTVTDKMSFSGFVAVDKNTDGTFTVPLTNGRNIVKLEKDGKATYQLITAKSVEITVNGTALADAMLVPGEDVVIKFNTLYDPLKRMSLYNVSTAVIYDTVSGYEGKTAGSARGSYGYYFYAATEACQTISSLNELSTDDSGFSNNMVKLGDKLTVPTDYAGEYFTLSNGTFNVGGFSHYNVGDWRTVLGSNATTSGFSANIMTYLGKLPDISIPMAKLEAVEISTQPAKTTYAIGESFDPTGMVVQAAYKYGDSTKKVEISDYTYDSTAFAEAGNKEVVVSYTTADGVTKTAQVDVEVTAVKLQGIEITTLPDKTMYNVGEIFDPAGMVVTASYDDGSRHSVSGYGFNNQGLTADTTKVTITYGNASADVAVTMNLVESIAITTEPNKTAYKAGEYFSHIGMVVTATYTDGTNKPTTDYRCAPTTALKTSSTYATVTYTGADASADLATVTQAITVTAAGGSSSGGSGSAGNASITVRMTFVDRGEIVVYNVPVTVYKEDTNGTYTISDAFKAMHRDYCPDGVAGYADENAEYEGWIVKFWGGDNSTLCYCYNNAWVYSTGQKIKANDKIAAYNGLDEVEYCDLYTYFANDSYTAKTGLAKSFTVNGISIMNSYANSTLKAYPVGADVSVYNAETGAEVDALATTVDEKGQFTLTFTDAGVYTVEVSGSTSYSSYTDAPVVPSRCTVSVTGQSTGGGATTAEDKAQTEQKTDEKTGEVAGSALPFVDVKANAWYYDAIKTMYDKGLMNGESEKQFMPNNKLSRAMLVTILYRMQNEPAVTVSSNFADVAAGQWYTKAVAWASVNNIVSGVGDGKFAPNDNVTRQEMAAMLYRYAKALGLNTTATAKLGSFTDGASVAGWATDAIKWAVGSGLIKGDETGALNPMGTATRAEVATVIVRLLGK